ncbi:MAG: hypothetical protein V3T31_07780 [candidate division Zixibacteria bacterium]
MIRNKILVGLIVSVLFIATNSVGITKAARTFNFSELSVSGGLAWGTYDGFPTQSFLLQDALFLAEFDGSELYDPSVQVAVNIGRLQGKIVASVGLRYSRHNLDEGPLVFSRGGDVWTISPANLDAKLSQYDIELNINRYFLSPEKNPISPYVGVGLFAGITHVDWDFFANEDDFNAGVSLNYGLDFRLAPVKGDGFWTISSVNRWEIAATGDRPRYLLFGGALKYFFR